MPQPQTLLEMAGVPARPHAWSQSALLLIDMQNEYLDGKLPLPGAQAALGEAAKLLAAARRAGRPVLHVRHVGRVGGLFDPATRAFSHSDQVTPLAEEAVIDKALPNAFAKTDLHDRLAALGVKSVIVGGFMTHLCISSTVRAALDFGYGCTVVAEATGTRDLPDGGGGIIPAAALQRAELAALADRFAIVVPNAAALG